MTSRAPYVIVASLIICVAVLKATDYLNRDIGPITLPQASGSGATVHDPNGNYVPAPIDSHAVLDKHDLIYNTARNTVPIVNEEYNIIFFQVAKAASSEWLRFFTRLSGNPAWCGKNIHLDEVNKLKRLSDYSISKAQMMMTDPTWTKAIFVRNPKTRLLSSFLDKAILNTRHFKIQECYAYERNGGEYESCVRDHQNFDFFLYNITVINSENVHWRPIYSRIDEKWWPYMNYIANMENLSEDAEHFLKSIVSSKDGVSAWDRIGITGWSSNERDCNTNGEKAFLAKKDKKHTTNAGDKLRNYYTPAYEKFVELRYWKDFNNPYFHFSPLQLYPTSEQKQTITGKNL